NVRGYGADLLHITENNYALLCEQLLGHRPCRDTPQCLARARPAAAAIIAKAIFRVKCEISMAGAILILDVAIILAALIGVMKENADGRAVGFALKDAGPDLRHIFFLALRNDLRLARPPPSQVRHKMIHRKRQTGVGA